MKSLLSLLFVVMLAASGCASYTVTSAGGRTTIDVENTGWYLLCFAPIASGHPDHPNWIGCKFFEDSVTMANNMKILRLAMASEDVRQVENVVTHATNEKVLMFLLKRYTMHTSAELIK